MEYNLLIQVLVCLSEETQVRKYVIRRFIQLIPVLIGITFLSFAMMRMAGSDAITELYGDKGAVAQEVIDAKKAELGLDKPFLTQYFAWLGGMLTGDMGTSYVSGKEVFPTFVSKLPATLLLTALSILMTVVISIPLGVLAAVNHDRFIDYILRFISFIGNSLPNFFVALLLMQLLAIKLKWLPVISSGTTLRSAIMPTLTLAIAMSAKPSSRCWRSPSAVFWAARPSSKASSCGTAWASWPWTRSPCATTL